MVDIEKMSNWLANDWSDDPAKLRREAEATARMLGDALNEIVELRETVKSLQEPASDALLHTLSHEEKQSLIADVCDADMNHGQPVRQAFKLGEMTDLHMQIELGTAINPNA